MAITFTNLGSSATPDFNDVTNLTAYSTASWSPPTTGIIVAVAYTRKASAGGVAPTSVTGNSLTWVKQGSGIGVGRFHISIWCALASGATTGATTFDFNSVSQAGFSACFLQVTGADESSGLSSAIIQTPTNNGNGSSGTLTYSSPADSNSRPFAAFGIEGIDEAITHRTNWTEADEIPTDVSETNPGRLESQYRSDAFETTGSATWSTTIDWYAVGLEFAAASGTDTSSSADAYLRGGVDTSNSTDAYLKGKSSASDSTSAYLQGGISSSSSTPAFMMCSTLDVSVSFAYLQIPDTYGGGISTSKAAYLKGSATAQDNVPAYLVGQVAATDNRDAYLRGSTDTSDSQDAFLKGSTSAQDSVPAYLKGQNTASDDVPAYLEGQSSTTDSKSAYLKGSIDTSGNKSAYLEGVPSRTSHEAYLKGSQDTTSSKDAYLHGSQDTSDNQNAFLQGISGQIGSQEAYLAGQDTATSSQDAYLRGSIDVTDSRDAFLSGQISATDSRSAYLKGKSSTSGSQDAYLVGSIDVTTSQDAYLSGSASQTSSVDAFLAGTSTAQDSKYAYLLGSQDASDSQDAYLSGYQHVTASHSAYLYGMGERLTPDGDVSQSGSWKREDNSTSNLYQSIDEYPGADDSDYVWHDNAAVGNYFEVTLSNPQYGTMGEGDVAIFYRIERRAGTQTMTLKMELREGTTVIASESKVLTDTETTYRYTLTTGEKSSVTDWTNLRLRFTVESVS